MIYMATRLEEKKSVSRELYKHVHDSGKRNLIVTIRGDGFLEFRAKGLETFVLWGAEALYEKGIKEGRVMRRMKRTVIKENSQL